MTYNGIGLTTPRGSGTNGYIQKNFAHVRIDKPIVAIRPDQMPKTEKIQRNKHKEIQLHEKKRLIELQLLQKRNELEDAGLVPEDEVERILGRIRKNLLRSAEVKEEQESKARAVGRSKPTKSLEDFGKAFGVREDYQEGAAFDKELQEQKKQELILKRQAAELRKAKEEADLLEQAQLRQAKAKRLAKDSKREQKEAAKAEKREKKAARKLALKAVKQEAKGEAPVEPIAEPPNPVLEMVLKEKEARDASRIARKQAQEDFERRQLQSVVVKQEPLSPLRRPRVHSAVVLPSRHTDTRTKADESTHSKRDRPRERRDEGRASSRTPERRREATERERARDHSSRLERPSSDRRRREEDADKHKNSNVSSGRGGHSERHRQSPPSKRRRTGSGDRAKRGDSGEAEEKSRRRKRTPDPPKARTCHKPKPKEETSGSESDGSDSSGSSSSSGSSESS
eukprot:NODE_1544_length_1466_cov_131.873786_g1464_i0.p1 GENE.NODE_1544_length_1466_cov_131.873786_g1464_i0~~NODE_1544_length_1466_cov_131.873786_g1464_i0.p1  ORF type:complete len:455 (-),score=85.44 NODE_1544_length_1466_cov_131.873786_g1464_i0:52-1416(-)